MSILRNLAIYHWHQRSPRYFKQLVLLCLEYQRTIFQIPWKQVTKLSVIDNSDFIVLTEIGNCSDLEIVGYKSFVQCSTPNQSRKGGRNSGGIALFYKS